MIEASANLLAITREIREARLDYIACHRRRVEEGYEWALAEANALQRYREQVRLDAETARRTLEFGR